MFFFTTKDKLINICTYTSKRVHFAVLHLCQKLRGRERFGQRPTWRQNGMSVSNTLVNPNHTNVYIKKKTKKRGRKKFKIARVHFFVNSLIQKPTGPKQLLFFT